MSLIRLLPVFNTRALLAIDGPANATWNTIIEASTAYEGPAGNAVTFTATADGSGTGSITVAGTAVTFHFANTVTTVANFEAALAASAAATALMRVKTAGTTQSYALLSAGDAFAATNLAGGGATSGSAPSIADPTAGVALPFSCDQAVILVQSAAGSGTMTATVRLWGFSPNLLRWFDLGALNGGSAIPETSISNEISYAEGVAGLRAFSRLTVVASVSGTGTEIAVYAACIRAEPVTVS